MKKLKQCYQWFSVVLVSCILVSMPMLACKSAPLTPTQQQGESELFAQADDAEAQAEFDQAAALLAEAEGDIALSAQLQADAASESARAESLRAEAVKIQNGANETQTKGILDFALGWLPIPDSAKGMIAGAATPLIAGIAFPRSREHYKKALMGVFDSVIALNPVGSSMAPGEAIKQLVGAFQSFRRGAGYAHTTDDPAVLEQNAEKLRARQDVTEPV